VHPQGVDTFVKIYKKYQYDLSFREPNFGERKQVQIVGEEFKKAQQIKLLGGRVSRSDLFVLEEKTKK
jgi:hypothetical protein